MKGKARNRRVSATGSQILSSEYLGDPGASAGAARVFTWGAGGDCLRGEPDPMSLAVHRPPLLVADRWRDYQLVDCGEGMKLERWGPYTLVRPDPQVLWPARGRSPRARWEHWDGFYHRSEAGGGRWSSAGPCPSTGRSGTTRSA